MEKKGIKTGDKCVGGRKEGRDVLLDEKKEEVSRLIIVRAERIDSSIG